MLEKRNNWVWICALALVIISLVFLIIALNIETITVLQKQVISTKLTIGDKKGIAADADMLSFGNVTSNSYGSRDISIGNSFDFPVQYEFSAEGNISEYLLFPKAVYLEVGETKIVRFSTIFITNETKGDYSGNIIVKVRKWIE